MISAATTYPLTLNDVLDIKYLGKWAWSPDGRQIAYIWDNGGIFDLWVVEADPVAGAAGGARQISKAKKSVADFAWRPGTAPSRGELAYIQDGNVWVTGPGTAEPRLLIQGEAKHSSVVWSPDGATLVVVRDGAAWLLSVATGAQVQVAVPGKVQGGGRDGRPPLSWSPQGSKLAVSFSNSDRLPTVAVAASDGKLIWKSRSADPAVGATWVDESTLFYAVTHQTATEADFYLVDLGAAGSGSPASATAPNAATAPAASGAPEVLAASAQEKRIYHVATDGRGAVFSVGAWPSPDGRSILFLLENDGWLHLYLYDSAADTMRQLTFGECEDFGHAGDEPEWAPGGRYVAYTSNRGSAGERKLWLLDAQTGAERVLVDLPGQNTQPRWSPDGRRIAFLHCDAWRAPDLWVADVAQGTPSQLTFGIPTAWSAETVSHPEEVVYKGALDWDIHGYLYKPQDFDPARRYPGIVWVHGGPVRQMRPGFNPMRSYALFHAFHMYLVQKGYVVLEINYRGGTGYSRAFRTGLYHKMGVDDVVDVVNGGRYLKGLPYVDPEKVAVYGLSYGGYMTLHALGQYPDEFCLGINIAGVYDFAQWTRWIEGRSGRHATGFKVNFGGHPDESPELYRVGSPCTYIANVRRPLINVQGTKDMNVDFAQLDRIVKDCVDLGKEYEAYYYPDEVHTFSLKKTWLDAFPKIEREFEKRLKAD